MTRFQIYLHTASRLIREHGGREPFSVFLKKYFSREKKYGSRDRKAISSIAYSYYRAGHALGRSVTDENLLHALFLCGSDGFGTLLNLAPLLVEKISLPAEERLSFLGLRAADLFPFAGLLSERIDKNAFCLSLLEQPDLFLRVRPGSEEAVTSKLSGAGLSYELCGAGAIRLANQSPVDDVLALNREAVVQDLSSQQVLDGMTDMLAGKSTGRLAAWDCCAASGGKSILLYDLLQGRVDITLSDIRESILHNASARLSEAGVPVLKSFMADLTSSHSVPASQAWPLIIADLPCTGSGTWARTPEQSYYFDSKSLSEFATRQKKIVENISAHLAPGGLLIYITCSVFAAENESLLAQVLPESGLVCKQEKYIAGYEKRADSLFSAICSR